MNDETATMYGRMDVCRVDYLWVMGGGAVVSSSSVSTFQIGRIGRMR